MGKRQWKMLATAAGIVAGFAARKAAAGTWELIAEDESPSTKAQPGKRELLLWAGISAPLPLRDPCRSP